jgi:general secretion pathway protein D
LFAFQFDIEFNPAVLRASYVQEGALFRGRGVSFSRGVIDNMAGTITFIGDAISGPGPGVSGDGTLAEIIYHPAAAGSSRLELSNVVLLNSELRDVSAAISGGAVIVRPVPEPITGVLVLTALSAIVGPTQVRGQKHKRRRIASGAAPCSSSIKSFTS